MRITLHDNIHPSGGAPAPEGRPVISDAARAPWVRAMHGRLGRVPRDGGTFAADLDVDVGTLRLRAERRGAALAAVWSTGRDERVVAASLLLAGAAAADDEAAVRALRDRVPRLPFAEYDYAALAAEQRPCLGTLYLDARWFDNARVELAATALALASMYGPDGRLTVQGGAAQGDGHRPAPASPVGPWADVGDGRPGALKFNFTRERLQVVMEMVTKKGSAAIDGVPGHHFRVYPPREFLERPGVLRGRAIFDALVDTVWGVRWYDNRCDDLSFGEFLGFVDQVVRVEQAYLTAAGVVGPPPSGPQNTSRWGRPASQPANEARGARRPVLVGRTLDVRELVEDATIRRLFAAVSLEPAPMAAEATRGKVSCGQRVSLPRG